MNAIEEVSQNTKTVIEYSRQAMSGYPCKFDADLEI